jgi:transposase
MVDVFRIYVDDNYLSILSMGEEEPEFRMLPKTAAMLRMDKQLMAESFRKEGMGYARIAALLDVPESTVRGWLSRIHVNDRYSAAKEGEYGLLPAHMRNQSEKQNETEEKIESEKQNENEEKIDTRKQPDKLHNVGNEVLVETPFQSGIFTVNLVRAVG